MYGVDMSDVVRPVGKAVRRRTAPLVVVCSLSDTVCRCSQAAMFASKGCRYGQFSLAWADRGHAVQRLAVLRAGTGCVRGVPQDGWSGRVPRDVQVPDRYRRGTGTPWTPPPWHPPPVDPR